MASRRHRLIIIQFTNDLCLLTICILGQDIDFHTLQGKPCNEHSDCPEACMNSGKCGPFLRMGRLPPQKHEDQCKEDSQCSGEAESCIATLRGLECRSWQDLMVEVFKLGNFSKHDINPWRVNK